MDNLNTEILGDLKVCVPPLDEQQEILKYIEIESIRVDSLQKLTEKSLDLLKEKRAALIAAAVSGQLRIPEPAHVLA